MGEIAVQQKDDPDYSLWRDRLSRVALAVDQPRLLHLRESALVRLEYDLHTHPDRVGRGRLLLVLPSVPAIRLDLKPADKLTRPSTARRVPAVRAEPPVHQFV